MRERTSQVYEFGPFRLDATERLLLCEDKPVPVTFKAFKILLLLVENFGHVVEREEIMKRVWPDDFVEESNLTQHVFILRRLLSTPDGDGHYIETIPRRGYRFMGTVRDVSTKQGASGEGRYGVSPIAEQREMSDPINKVISSLAVLPLTNLTTDPYTEYLCDGITESIINAISQLPHIRVMARSTVLRYKGMQIDPQKVGKDLNVQAVMIGRAIQVEDNLVIGTELVDVIDGSQLWGEQYNRKLSSIFALQEEISRDISNKLRIKISGE